MIFYPCLYWGHFRPKLLGCILVSLVHFHHYKAFVTVSQTFCVNHAKQILRYLLLDFPVDLVSLFLVCEFTCKAFEFIERLLNIGIFGISKTLEPFLA